MKQWEYMSRRAEKGILVAELNKLGSQGWELASVFTGYYTDEHKDMFNYTFKRQRVADTGPVLLKFPE